MSILEIQDLSVHFGGEAILDGITLSVKPGECLAIVGESGAGKSVLTRTLLGLTQAESQWRVSAGRFDATGRDMRAASQRDWRRLRGAEVGLILQDALQSLDPLRTIEAEVGEALAVRDRGALWRNSASRRALVLDALQRAGLPNAADHLRQRSGELSGGMRQRALIASAIAANPQLVIADEPTTALDPATAARVLDLFAEIRASGTALLLISHDLRSVARIANRIAVLDRGRIVELGEATQILNRPQHTVTQQLLAASPSGPKPGPTRAPGEPLITVTAGTRSFARGKGGKGGKGETRALDSVSFELRRGEAVGVLGESGAGKTTLARVLVGAERLDSGTVSRAGAKVRLIPQDPLASFDPRWRVERIIAASNRLPDTTVAELLAMVGLEPELARRRPASLSGGQRQRVAIARALAADPDVLVCDEPVSALDMRTQAGILELLRRLQRERGLTIVFVSHDVAALRTVSDRVLVMRSGRIIEQGPTEAVFAGTA
ncbi:ABC transporter ATP-binding protein [Leucobacter insecticola]|uniref:ABC transporter ATP-binding protein n=1 Tax=Leucobacter insecticola TaxID=2714934 RepID=A0A6G8FL86_9MICO|nr:ABC transporter ATP-binding protein [Leucobacter insecticola]QIM17137.1 ABC transporter ATP-binding protein [Leucobacter insecticola]